MHEKPPFDLNDFRPRMFPPRYIPIVVAVGLLLLGISTSVHRIEAQEVGVVQRFGKFNRILEPGLNFALPFFIEFNDFHSGFPRACFLVQLLAGSFLRCAPR